MDKRWLGIRVELIGGRGQILDPRPGRSFAVPPDCTFDEFGRAIDLAFARWDLSHLRQFTLEDGTLVVDEETAEELGESASGGGAMPRTLPLSRKIGRQLKVGSSFTYSFDLGDDWTHECTVESYVHPLEVLGDIPDRPMPYFGWGNIPDQYGRQQADGGRADEPAIRSDRGDDRLGWSGSASMPMIDRTKLRIAVASGKVTEVVAAISGVEMGSALQQVGAGLLKAYRTAEPAERSSLAPILFSLSQRLKERGWTGDNLLAAEFLAEIRGEELKGRPLPVDLDEMSTIMADHSDYPGGGYLNLETGEVVYASLTDAALVGEDAAVDLDEGDWEHVVDDSHEGWDDMADFAVSIKDPTIRETLEDAIQGKGAFSRFRRAVHRVDLAEEWYCFADDRRWGRARQELADLGIRPV